MLSERFKRKIIFPARGGGHYDSNSPDTKKRSRGLKKKVIHLIVSVAFVLALWYDDQVTQSMKFPRKLSINLGNGTCEWVAALQYTDEGFPTYEKFHKTIIAGYPSGDKRMAYLQLEALTGLSARDEWDFAFLGMTNQPFINANYPHHKGIWGWKDVGDQVILLVSDIKRVLIEYHDILWDIGYAQTFEEAYERIEHLYQEINETGEEVHAPVEDFLVWRDLRIFDEIHWYSWFIEYYMESGLQRDMFNHKMTLPTQWKIAILPNFFTKFEMRHGRFVDENETVTPSYDPMCATLTKGCYPVLIVDPEKLVDPILGPAEARKVALVVNGTEGFDDWMIEEEAWECLWKELIIEKKGLPTFLDKEVDYESYTYSFELRNEMWHEVNRLIEKFEVQNDTVAVDLVSILKRHLDGLGVTDPVDPLTYEELMSYHLEFPPFFPNQKMFKSDDDFYVRVHEKYDNPNISNIDSIIDRRRAWFELEMEKKRKRKVDIKYYVANQWSSLPPEGLASLTPYHIDKTTTINYQLSQGNFAGSGRADDVAALFQGYLHIDPMITDICLTSDDGSKLFLNDMLVIDNDGLHDSKRVCSPVTSGVFKLDIEYFEKGGESELILTWTDPERGMRVVPPRAWASSDAMHRFRNLMKLNEKLEEDLRTLKETDLMGPATRAEFERRKNMDLDPAERERKLKNKPDFSKLDKVLAQRRYEQLVNMHRNTPPKR
eukprot:CAMPEP_0203662092 /NCGR_PEP_ID=MMETSP0090-20130426/179_1 /ASSEMBLY_ACC=CAM_ASM_001088 /TAXON_ID=426623 /ORGANISM="Chaetoceros affinis, Strain CCMP159" /LENGTH=716 /DNA_ID=CAMNT_0050524837 /DNA_START=368 /DNA_END=2518 /DNA_ORIENTATION=-